jgi:adenosylhomocysteine nucleosidase
MPGSSGAPGAVGVLAALPEELAPLQSAARERRRVQGLTLWERDHGPTRMLLCVAGIGKVRAARAAALLLAELPLDALFVVGVAGGLVRSLAPGTLVHCTRAVQADCAVREGREVEASPRLRSLWRGVAPGAEGWFLTADRPVLSPWRRLRLARAFAGPCVADMETAAAASVAALAGVPWAALRAVSDRAGFSGGLEFRRNFPALAGRAAETLPALFASLGAPQHSGYGGAGAPSE